ncbi:MAG: pentapeptide repeat-containing protein, partial [Actinobacteria bacterium]|nr:pentapeptide repeat-containing protein [Actinomycetota bacterium]
FRQDRMVPQRPVEVTNLEACKFVECNLNKSYFRRCTLNSVVFINCDLSQSDFSSTDLSHVEFNNCFMEGTVFTRSVSTEVKFNACDFGKSSVPILKEKKLESFD